MAASVLSGIHGELVVHVDADGDFRGKVIEVAGGTEIAHAHCVGGGDSRLDFDGTNGAIFVLEYFGGVGVMNFDAGSGAGVGAEVPVDVAIGDALGGEAPSLWLVKVFVERVAARGGEGRGAGSVLDADKAFSIVGRGAAFAFFDVDLNDVGALVANNLIGAVVDRCLRRMSIDRYAVPADAELAAGVRVVNSLVDALIRYAASASLRIYVLIDAIDSILDGEARVGNRRSLVKIIGTARARQGAVESDHTIGSDSSHGMFLSEESKLKGQRHRCGEDVVGVGEELPAAACGAMESSVWRVVRDGLHKVGAVELRSRDERRCVQADARVGAVDDGIPSAFNIGTIGRAADIVDGGALRKSREAPEQKEAAEKATYYIIIFHNQ